MPAASEESIPFRQRVFTFRERAPEGERRRPLTLRELTQFVGGHGSVIWESSVAVAQLLLLNPELVRGRSVLELGSGCGLGGLAAAAVGADVTLTDNCSAVLVNLSENARINALQARVEMFDWAGELHKQSGESKKFDVILGADLVYNPRYGRVLARAIKLHLRKGGLFIGVSPAGRPGFLLFMHSLQQQGLHMSTCPLLWYNAESKDVQETLWNGADLGGGRHCRDVGSDTESCESTYVTPRTPPFSETGSDGAAEESLREEKLPGQADNDVDTGNALRDFVYEDIPLAPEPCVRLPSVEMESKRGGEPEAEFNRGVITAHETLMLFTICHADGALIRPLDLGGEAYQGSSQAWVRSKQTVAGCTDMIFSVTG